MAPSKIPLVVVCGPTASGKTALSVAIAKELSGEVISADSMQIYRHMDIGTAKPTKEEMEGIPHHMIDVAAPDENFSAARYREMAKKAISSVAQRGKTPILAGGTGFYISAVIDDIPFAPAQEDGSIRQSLNELLEERGREGLMEELKKVDPVSASRLHINDTKRVMRALEIYRLTGKTAGEHKDASTPSNDYDVCAIGLNFERREDLYRRIDERVDNMVAAGLFGEVKGLLGMGVTPDSTAMQAIGYKEAADAILGNLSTDAAIAAIKQNSRRYAKRQLTWFRRDRRINWIVMDKNPSIDHITTQAMKIIASNFSI